jgi:hypothetical protein
VVKGRRPSAPAEDREAAARGTPAPVMEGEVEALRHGKLDETRVASILEGHKQPEVGEVPRRAKKMAPVDLDERAVRELSEGSTPTAIQRAMEKAARKDRDRAATIDGRQDRPRQKPPR